MEEHMKHTPHKRTSAHARGYRPPAQNPYMQAVKTGRDPKFQRVSKGYVPERSKLQRGPKPKKPFDTRHKIIAGAVVVVLIALGIFGYTHRPVEIMVNGQRRTYTIGTSAGKIFADNHFEVKPGNLVSVSKKVLEEGKGYPYELKVGDKTYVGDEAKDYHIQAGDNLEFSNGPDIMEDHTTETKEIQPKLISDGKHGSVAYISQWGKIGKQEILTGKVSGETVEGDMTEKVQDCIISHVNPQPKDNQKLIAITFDDGPSKYTQQILDILKQKNAHATFFCLGSEVKRYPQLAKAIVDNGHQIASHSYDHPLMTKTPADKIYEQFKSSFAEIKSATGLDVSMIRPPYGAFDLNCWDATKGIVTSSILWSIDSLDWKRPGVDTIVKNVVSSTKPGDIILMHDGGGPREQDVEALPKILDRLQADGYTVVSVAELLKSDPDIPAEIANGTATMPQDAVWPTTIGK